jgi:electron transfer flavoprotein alpha/beta subunit
MSNNTNKLTTFLDAIGRTIIGKITNETDEILSIQNPALVAVQPNVQSGQIQLQILPLFFKEFQADRNEATVWHYKKSNITLADDITFVVQFTAQYEQLFAPAAAAPQSEPSVVKLFEN